MNLFIHILESIALLSCTINFKKLESKALKGFLFLLILTNIVEWGNHYKLFIINHSNNWVANLRNPIEFAFIGWFYIQIIENPIIKKRIKYLSWVILLSSVINFCFFQGFRYLNSYTIILGSCICVYYIFEYFKQMMNTPGSVSLFKNSYFWISVGFLFFYTGQSILLSFFQYFLSINNFKPFLPIWEFFITLIIIILYSCLTISFFCRLKPTNTSLQES